MPLYDFVDRTQDHLLPPRGDSSIREGGERLREFQEFWRILDQIVGVEFPGAELFDKSRHLKAFVSVFPIQAEMSGDLLVGDFRSEFLHLSAPGIDKVKDQADIAIDLDVGL